MSEATVCILAAGAGSKMGELTRHLPQALLEVGGKAAISHLVDAFPARTKFVVAVAPFASLIEDYLALAHPDREFHCVLVNPDRGAEAGELSSVLACRRHLPESFYLASCEGLWSAPYSSFPTNRSWVGVCRIEDGPAENFRGAKIDADGLVTELEREGEKLSGEALRGVVGLAFVHNGAAFFGGLDGCDGERLADGFRALASDSALHAVPVPSWVDIGTEERLRALRARLGSREFDKRGEEIYVSLGGVIKFFADPKIVTNRFARVGQLAGLVPPLTSLSKNFYRYDFIPGGTFYERGTPQMLERLLSWLEDRLWAPVPDISAEEFRIRAQEFYFEKTMQRVKPFCAEHPGLREEIASSIDWARLFAAGAARFHGDLNLANILIREGSEEFVLIDWRHDFGGATGFGDVGYDLAKLLASMRVDFSGTNVGLRHGRLPVPVNGAAYERRLWEYLEKRGCDRYRIEMIVALIFLNMAGIHPRPLSEVFFRLGLGALRALARGDRTEVFRNVP